MNKLIIVRGLQGSGKSTLAEKWLAEEPTRRSRINRDTIRKTYFNSYWGEGVNEETVTEIEHGIVRALMIDGITSEAGRDIMVDNTNLKAASVIPYLQFAEDFEYEVEFIDIHVPLEELLQRDGTREKPVGEDVIRFYWDTYTDNGVFPEIPTLKVVVPQNPISPVF